MPIIITPPVGGGASTFASLTDLTTAVVPAINIQSNAGVGFAADANISLLSNGTATISAPTSLNLESNTLVQVTAPATMTVTCGGDINLDADSSVSITGPSITIDFAATTAADWDGGVSPATMQAALNQLAARIAALEP